MMHALRLRVRTMGTVRPGTQGRTHVTVNPGTQATTVKHVSIKGRHQNSLSVTTKKPQRMTNIGD